MLIFSNLICMFDGGKQLSVSYKDSGSLCKRSTGWIPDPAENYHQFINFDVPPPSPLLLRPAENWKHFYYDFYRQFY